MNKEQKLHFDFFHTFTPSFQSVAKSSKKYFSLGATSLVKIGEVGISGEMFRFGTTLNSTINFMTRGFDD